MATRNDRRIISATDDIAKMMKQVLASYASDGHEIDVGPILSVTEDIFRCATALPSNIDGVPNGTHERMHELHDNKSPAASGTLEALSDIIHKISCEISCKCSGGQDAHATTMALFNTLSSYSWDAKIVLSLAAFAVNYGEFCLVAQLYAENSLAKSVAVLKQLHHIPAYDNLKPQFDELNKLIKAMLGLTKSIVNLKQLRTKYLSPEGLAKFNEAHFQAAYLTFQSIVACNSRTLSPTGLRHEEPAPTTEEMELSTLAHKVTHTVERLNKQSESWKQEIEKNLQDEEYQKLKDLLDKKNKDIMEVLRALIYATDLVDGETKTKVQIDVLNKKHVSLLISSLDDLSTEEILVLKQVYKELKESKECRIVWLPIVDKSVDWQHKFENLQKEMPWYTVQDPTMIRPAVIKYIKKVWKFSKKAILVAVDPQGRILNQNAFHMLQIWGTSAFPFTAEREAALWKESSWNELLFGCIDATILQWMKEDRLVCLYGGEDEAWIREFTNSAKAVASNPKIKLGVAYVGKKNAKKRPGAISSILSSIITKDDSSHILMDTNAMWSFWARLESIFYSKLPGMSVENDNIMQKVMALHNFDGSEQGWAIFWGGKTQEIAGAKGKEAIDSMEYLRKWQDDASPEDIIRGLNNYLQPNPNGKHCNRVVIPCVSGEIPGRVACKDCGHEMEKFFMYSCCAE